MSITNAMRGAVAAAIIAALPATAWAQTPAEFYKGKNVDLMVGYSAGGGYDVYARMIARYIGKHIPGNPTVVVKNLDGAVEKFNQLISTYPNSKMVANAQKIVEAIQKRAGGGASTTN